MGATIHNFRKPYREPPDQEQDGIEPRRPSLLRIGLRLVGRALRQILFLTLLWIRAPIRFLLGLAVVGGGLSGVILLIGIAGGYSTFSYTLPAWAFGISFGASCVMWGYDSLLLALATEPIFLN